MRDMARGVVCYMLEVLSEEDDIGSIRLDFGKVDVLTDDLCRFVRRYVSKYVDAEIDSE
ncbi:hypothetical protein LCGC14_2474400 [marine sediment metagenome]|uniref:Uncharacterized protein n=1 Tax=marine sediment metagenome TaxID=412755 RepID=A0A0F9BXB4_9ZZZZ